MTKHLSRGSGLEIISWLHVACPTHRFDRERVFWSVKGRSGLGTGLLTLPTSSGWRRRRLTARGKLGEGTVSERQHCVTCGNPGGPRPSLESASLFFFSNLNRPSNVLEGYSLTYLLNPSLYASPSLPLSTSFPLSSGMLWVELKVYTG